MDKPVIAHGGPPESVPNHIFLDKHEDAKRPPISQLKIATVFSIFQKKMSVSNANEVDANGSAAQNTIPPQRSTSTDTATRPTAPRKPRPTGDRAA